MTIGGKCNVDEENRKKSRSLAHQSEQQQPAICRSNKSVCWIFETNEKHPRCREYRPNKKQTRIWADTAVPKKKETETA